MRVVKDKERTYQVYCRVTGQKLRRNYDTSTYEWYTPADPSRDIYWFSESVLRVLGINYKTHRLVEYNTSNVIT